jgi:GT2 family glycosyltransferase
MIPHSVSLLRRRLERVLAPLRPLLLGPWANEVFPRGGIHGALEAPARASVVGRTVEVSGWIVSRRAPIVELLVASGGAPEPAPLAIERPDVAELFPELPTARRSGFRALLPVAELSGWVEVQVWAVLADGQRRLCFTRRVAVAPTRAPLPPAPPPPAPDPDRPVASSDLAARELDQLRLAQTVRQPSPAAPRCSIIIPVLGQWRYTYACLRSILLARVEASFEIIVVDNGSTDATPELLAGFAPRVRALRNEVNAGFVGGCNQGAAAATGEHLVFLNNDTEVRPGWLDRLVETVERFDRVGAVGAKLLYPDGTLQEAGGIVFSDGSGANYGKWQDPAEPRFRFLREVDYCSAACLLVPRRVFEEVGGLDLRYMPAYYEDTDLCFGLRARGYQVLYQPLAEVVHHEGGTAGQDVTRGFKRNQVRNRERFLAKWAGALARQPAPEPADLDVVADRRTGPRILVIDHQIPRCDEDSGSVRSFAVVEMLAQLGCRVSFCLRGGAPFDRHADALGAVGVRVVPEDRARDELARGGFDLALIARVDITAEYLPVVRRLAPAIPVVFDTVDVHFVRELRRARVLGDAAAERAALATKDQEVELARRCDLVVTVTEEDRAQLLREDPRLRVHIIPNVHRPAAEVPARDARSGLIFVGGFGHPPNVDAAAFAAREILPRVHGALGAVELYLVGSRATVEVEALASDAVIVTGQVPDVAVHLARRRVFIAPLRYGAGMKGKIGQALAHGVPVVTTTIGAEGMGLTGGETALIADDPDAFAAAVVRLYTDVELWHRLSRSGRALVAERFSPEAVRPQVDRLRRLGLDGALA